MSICHWAHATSSSSCSSITGVCTLIGCESGLVVLLERRPEGAFRVELWHSGSPGEPRYVRECTPVAPCGDRIFFSGYTGTQAQVTVTTATDTVTTAVRPEYETTRPNGPRCEPECRLATVQVQAPG